MDQRNKMKNMLIFFFGFNLFYGYNTLVVL